MDEPSHPPRRRLMRVTVTDERRTRLLVMIKAFYADRFGEELSDFRAASLLDFFVELLGPPVYNQAIQDARAFVEDKLVDLEGEFYEVEDPDTS